MRWTPESLAAAAGGRLLQAGDAAIAGAFIDSRAPRPGGLFVPIVAARDGHDFIESAARGGAAATLLGVGRSIPAGAEGLSVVEVEDTLVGLSSLARDARERIEGPVVAITGSNGKTTTRAYVRAVLATAYSPLTCTRGNLNNHLGVPLTLLDQPHEPAAAVLELGMSAAGENDHLASLVRPHVHVITSIGLEHLEFMGTLEAIAAAEAEPIAHLEPVLGGPGAALVVPVDEPSLAPHLPPESAGVRVLRVGPGEADVSIARVEVGAHTLVRLKLRDHEAALTLRLRAFGAHNARTAASAIAVAMHLDLPLEPLAAALEAVEPVGDRGRVLELGPHLLIADCYNANPGSMVAALDSLAHLRSERAGPLVAVLGDMLELGARERELHREVGEHAARLGVDALLAFGPLSKDIHVAAAAAGVETLHLEGREPEDVDRAVAWLRGHLASDTPGAALFKASRGLRLERVVQALTEQP